MNPDDRLIELGLTLPPPALAVANYAPTVISNGIIYTSGQLPWVAGDLKYAGKIGSDLTFEQGYQACRLSAHNALAQIHKTLGSLNKAKRIIRLEGVLNLAPGFLQMPGVLNGASDAVAELFGDRGTTHTRMVYGSTEMPFNCASLIVLWAEVDA